MEKVSYRRLTESDVERMREIDASQYIGRAWREVDGARHLVTIDYEDPDWPNGYDHHYSGLRRTIREGGIAFGAFACHDGVDKLVGIATMERMRGEGKEGEALLDQLFISRDYRSRGIGKELFNHCLATAREWGVERIRIYAGSAEETIAFYFARGCREAAVIDREAEGYDPRDFPLEFLVQGK
jgi:GNAT superfamily N-acetyltransferase